MGGIFGELLIGFMMPILIPFFVFIYLPYQVLKLLFTYKPESIETAYNPNANTEYIDIKL